MKAKLTKVMAMASLAAFLTVGIDANVAERSYYGMHSESSND